MANGEPTAPRAPDWTFESASPEETEKLAHALAERLGGGEVILLRGPLGAGKTFFTAALASGLGIQEIVVSPTFVILRSYASPKGLTLHHLDFYRLSGDEDLEALGVEELPGAEAVVIVEWPERCPAAFARITMELSLTVTGDESRRIEGRYGELPFEKSGWPPSI